MSKTSPKGVFRHRSYTIEELSDLLDKDKKTISRWIDEGLETVPESKRPILIMGSDLKKFLRDRYSKRKVKMSCNQFYCFHCKKAVYAKRGSLENFGNRKTALCSVCRGKISRITKPYQKLL